MKHILKAHHQAMAKTYRQHAESLDDEHEHKALFHKLADHHDACAKALEAYDDTLPVGDLHGPRGKALGDRLMPSSVRGVLPDIPMSARPDNLMLIPRPGGPEIDTAKIPPELRQLLGEW
jgi:hypothetical protein